MNPLYQMLLTALGGFIAGSSGFWIYLRNRAQNHDATTRLLMGLAQDRITYLGMKYIERGYVYFDEYDDFRKYFYEPYAQLGGNGTAEHIMYALERLEIRHNKFDKLSIRGSDRTANNKGELDES